MNIASIKFATEKYSIEQLKQAENELLEEQALSIQIEGNDEGEQLTHILAAIYCKEVMAKEGINLNQAVRQYSVKVRQSIS